MIKKILVVDDEPHILTSMKELLELEDLIVEVAENGSVAFEKIKKTKFDLIISDAKMPQMNGQELLEETKKLNTDVKFIILTGESEFSQEKLKSMGADAVFYKPLDFDILIETISAL
jgi:YesN/AraC family two-component response regulator